MTARWPPVANDINIAPGYQPHVPIPTDTIERNSTPHRAAADATGLINMLSS